MARVEVVMPQMGESITTGTITKWHKQAGDTIELDAILLEISTDKVESEIPSPVEGKIVELLYPEGTTVDVGKPIAIIEDDMSAAVSAPAVKSAPAAQAAAAPVSAPVAAAGPSAPAHSSDERRFYTPLVKAMAAEAGISLSELANVKGSGAGGRINKSDLESYIASREGCATIKAHIC
jgi:2-oxoglutarate dehydrogenase E2 component (dihydrolipoamide succinyltransferase)